MKIDFVYETKKHTFEDIAVGECFRHNFTNFMKVCPWPDHKGNAVRLSNGQMDHFTDPRTVVEPLSLKVVKK